ncbi:dynein light chain Tctex-type protein 2B-like [Rhopilema esculentum]|uniref:dynein light chain Tctex-type protein 2B-like n=1 Tax=Rhopilema esculentum TaxID=499914 RepID=UPI0031DA0E03|eukprot:gene4948-21291_t
MDAEPIAHQRTRRSSIFSVEHHARDAGRSSISCMLDPRNSMLPPKPQKVLFENTYKMEPDKRFDLKKAKDLLDKILEENFSDAEYDPTKSGILAKRVSTIIKDRMKTLGFERFKYVCNVIIGQNGNHGIKVASRYLWDARRDNWINASFSNKELFVVASVFALYFE